MITTEDEKLTLDYLIKSKQLKSVLFQAMKEKHPITYKRWIRDLYKEKLGTLKSDEGFSDKKKQILYQYENNIDHFTGIKI